MTPSQTSGNVLNTATVLAVVAEVKSPKPN
jgi:hypothetical protein